MAYEHPKVFISHASEDKDRFVNNFATRLRARGVDAWVDKWEMLPGDSLVDKIFEEGIKNAQAMVVVLSTFSVQKPWVREELNAGVVKRISGKCKIIPIVLDKCEVPEALQSTVWERIGDLNSYDTEFDHLVSAIYGHTLKPPLGSPPNYTRLQIDNLPGLSRIDTIVFKTICEVSLETGVDWVGTDSLKPRMTDLSISEDELYESIDILAQHFFVKGDGGYGSKGLDYFQVTPHGFERYAVAFLSGFNELVNQVLVSIVNQDLGKNEAIASRLAKPRVLVDYILDILASRGFMKLIKTIDGGVHVTEVTAQGRRTAKAVSG